MTLPNRIYAKMPCAVQWVVDVLYWYHPTARTERKRCIDIVTTGLKADPALRAQLLAEIRGIRRESRFIDFALLAGMGLIISLVGVVVMGIYYEVFLSPLHR